MAFEVVFVKKISFVPMVLTIEPKFIVSLKFLIDYFEVV